MHWSGLNSDLKHFLKHIFRGEGKSVSRIFERGGKDRKFENNEDQKKKFSSQI